MRRQATAATLVAVAAMTDQAANQAVGSSPVAAMATPEGG
ncbi:MAG: hypothetical protein JWN00_378 [Actinomycetia bacterium]|nr:hypothetical protein [Actinomycetes bacterium]